MPINNRLYTITDSDLIAKANFFVEELRTVITEFSAFDQSINLTYPLQIAKLLNELSSFKSDNVFIQEQIELTKRIEILIEESQNIYVSLADFARKIPIEEKNLGIKKYAKARTKASKTLSFLEILKEELLRVESNSAEEMIQSEYILGELDEVISNLRTAIQTQEAIRSKRREITIQRIDILNEIYSLLHHIEKVAQFIYKENQLKLERFSLPSYEKRNRQLIN